MSEEKECCGCSGDKCCGEREQVPVKEVLYFVLISLPSGEHVLGKVSDSAYVSWASNQMKLVVRDAKALYTVPQKQGNKIVGFDFNYIPLYPEPTRQERLAIDATMVEILGEIETTDDVSYLVGNVPDRVNKMFNSYQDIVLQWRAEISGIALPRGGISTDKSLKLV